MSNEHKHIVSRGYDKLVDVYLEQYGRSEVRDFWLQQLIAMTRPGERVLDLGCGAGVPVARELASSGRQVLGIDASPKQIDAAHRNVPTAQFRICDMVAAEFEPATFDAVAAFYSIIHVPRAEHPNLFKKIASWLRPGGLFLASLGVGDYPSKKKEWLGVEMFFSHFDAATNKMLVKNAGLGIERAELAFEDDKTARILWVIARKPT
jgi:cyclopropane fatty-acyl-phospholipid synthase-like methyltransferase